MGIRTTLANDAGSVGRARRIVAREMSLGGCTGSTIDDARLLTSELASNAVRHAEGATTYDLTVALDDGVLHVGITDADPARPPAPRPPADGASSGRGMWLVDLIASKWGVDSSAPGKCVWFELPCAPASGSR